MKNLKHLWHLMEVNLFAGKLNFHADTGKKYLGDIFV